MTESVPGWFAVGPGCARCAPEPAGRWYKEHPGHWPDAGLSSRTAGSRSRTVGVTPFDAGPTLIVGARRTREEREKMSGLPRPTTALPGVPLRRRDTLRSRVRRLECARSALHPRGRTPMTLPPTPLGPVQGERHDRISRTARPSAPARSSLRGRELDLAFGNGRTPARRRAASGGRASRVLARVPGHGACC